MQSPCVAFFLQSSQEAKRIFDVVNQTQINCEETMTLRRTLTQLLFLFFLSENISGQFIINGSALHSGNGDYLLTPAQGAKAGSIWYEEKISLEESFELNFELYFGTKDNGADGITFCLQPLSNNVGVSGGGLGVQGVQPSFFVEFDTSFASFTLLSNQILRACVRRVKTF